MNKTIRDLIAGFVFAILLIATFLVARPFAQSINSFSAAQAFLFVGSGFPTITAPQGSIYIRTDGTSINDRAFINTNGSNGWTAIITAQ